MKFIKKHPFSPYSKYEDDHNFIADKYGVIIAECYSCDIELYPTKFFQAAPEMLDYLIDRYKALDEFSWENKTVAAHDERKRVLGLIKKAGVEVV